MSHPVMKPAHQAGNDSPFPPLSHEALLRMADAGAKVVDCIRDLNTAGSNLVVEALRGSGDFTEWEHYPPNDVYDLKSHAQYYFHAHPPDDRDAADYGHFHTFLRPKGMPLGIQPAKVMGHAPVAGANGDPSHLIAISMTPTGMPEALFTTNRWVTGETWYGADNVIAMLDRFEIDLDRPSLPLNQWLTAMFILFRPQIEQLIIERDRTMLRWQAEHVDVNVFEDRRLEITSSKRVSLYGQIEWLDQQLEARSPG
ncbi:hypothetical protein [Afipia sp. OHSU_I-C4]|nr:hypothetical protein [Afipia sp. OHSU_I-C4]